jgi:hypothetical protein
MTYRPVRSPIALIAAFTLIFSGLCVSQTSDGGAVLHDGAVVKLRVPKTLTSAEARPGDKVALEAADNVFVGNQLVIAKGAAANATITTVVPRKGRGHDGRLILHLDYVTLADGETVSLRGAGAANDPASQGFVEAQNSVNSADSPAGQYLHGKDAAFVAGTQITTYISGDMPLDLSRFAGPTTGGPSPPQMTRLELTSSPSAAEVDVDGQFISNTPASIGLAAGPHIVLVRMAGYQTWKRSVNASGGLMNFTANLNSDGSGSASNCFSGVDCAESVGDAARVYKNKKDDTAAQR